MKSKKIHIANKMILLAVLFISCFGGKTYAQVSVNINIGAQPVWGPVGYDYVEYYYIPDIDAYYDVPRRQYVYYDNRQWITIRSLPPRYRSFDMYSAYKVVINEPKPWMHHDRYRTQYSGYKGKRGQQAIRNSNEEKYWQNPRHPQHSKWKGNNGNGRGNGGNQGRDRGPDQRREHGQGSRAGNGRGQDQGRGNSGKGHGGKGHGGNGNDKGNGNGKGRGK